MHRAEAARPALLMATAAAALLVARVHAHSALEAINPWLSACDLVQPAATDDLQGACSVADADAAMPAVLPDTCPPPCAAAAITTATTTTITTTNSTITTSSTRTTTTSIITSTGNSNMDYNYHFNYQKNKPNNNNNNYNSSYYNNSRSSNSRSSSSSTSSFASTTNTNQCLFYLEESQRDAVCSHGGTQDWRLQQLQLLRLRHCCEHAVATTLQPAQRAAVLAGGAQCKHHLDALLEIDALAARISCEFTEVLTRYDCGQTYSIVYHCNDCKEAYRRWVCSSLVPHLTSDGGRIRPCRSVCQTVEQRCPYMLPGDRAPAHPTQYAGEPTFLCLDPNIPETGAQKEKSSYGDEECCYTYCGTPGRACNKCPPGGPSNATWPPVDCSAAVSGARPAAPRCRGPATAPPSADPPPDTNGSRSSSRTTNVHRTIIVSIAAAATAATVTLLLIHCSLLMNVNVRCERTTLALVKTKWKTRSS